MNLDAQLAESIRDSSHEFSCGPNPEFCRLCGQKRWKHVWDGHNPKPEHKYDLGDTKYRPGAHPYWTRPGQFNKKDNRKTPYPNLPEVKSV